MEERYRVSEERERHLARIKELEEMEVRFEMLTEATQMGTWDYYPLTGELRWSKECRKIHGTPIGLVITFDVYVKHIHPDDRNWVQEKIRRSMISKTNENYDVVYRILQYKSQSLRWIRAQGRVYRNDIGQAIRFIGTVLDITELKCAEEVSARLAAVISFSEDAIIGKTPDNLVTSWNQSAERIFGYSADEMIGQSIMKLIPADRRQEECHILQRLLDGERIGHFETTRLAKNGRKLDVSVSISPIRNEFGAVIGLSKIARDITLQKQAASLLQKSEEHFRLALKAADLGTFDLDLTSGVLKLDCRCRELFGSRSDQELTYCKGFLEGLHPDDYERINQILQDVFNQNKTDGNYDVQYRTISASDKKIRWVRTMGKVTFDENNLPKRFIGAVLDITEQKNEEIRKNDFVAMVSHELKTPLTSIYGYVQLLLEQVRQNNDTFCEKALTRVQFQTKKMISLIKDFLDIARLEEGKLQLTKSIFNLHHLLEEATREIEILNSHTIELVSCIEIRVMADREKISQVLINLLGNAAKYSPQGGRIMIGCEKDDHRVKISVVDEGVGIHPKHHARLFDRYYRVENEQLQHITGFGIGLYLTSEILHMHNSKIMLESDEGKGSTFYFHLPCV